MSKLEQLVEDLSNLTVLEAAELSKMLEDKWGVSAAAPVAMAAAMRDAVAAGRTARRAGRIPRLGHAEASSPQLGLIGS